MSGQMMRTEDEGRVEIVDWFAKGLERAIEFAEKEMAATAKARAYHLARMIERGVCCVGHDLSLPEIPINSLGTAPCGYCTNAREAMVS